MKYKKYPSYKDSGVEWLGEIPSEWGIKKLKYISSIQTGSTPLTSNDSYFSDEIGIPWIKPDELNNLVPIKTSKKFLTEKGKNVSRIIKKDSVLVCGIGTIGKFGIAGVDLTTNQQINSVTFNNKLNFNYGKFLIASSQQEMDKFSNGNVVKILNTESQKNIDYPFPSFEEQQQIANFLDKATAKIDTLIEKQTKQIELLKEKRQAVISHAVTKGINPNVPMKDSGVEWLGEIPEHWQVVPLRYLGNLQNGISKGAEFFGLGFPFINYGDIYKNDSLPKDIKGLANTSFEDRRLYSVKRGDVFFTRTSETIDDIGIASTCLETISNATFSGFTIRFREFSINLFPEFSRYQFRSGYSQRFFEKEMNLVTRASLGQDLLKRLHVMIPPFQEQQQIANYLDDKTSKIDTLIEKSKKSIELLKEKRTALISACVTGKIDVREAV